MPKKPCLLPAGLTFTFGAALNRVLHCMRRREFNSSGPGATPELLAQRVKWSRQLSAAQAAQWTAQSVLRGWTPPSEPA